MDGSNNITGGLSSQGLPPINAISKGSSSMTSKDIDLGLRAMNDELSHQIEFILQDPPMEHDGDDDEDDDVNQHSQHQQQLTHNQQLQQHQVLYQHQLTTKSAITDAGHHQQQLMDTETSNSQGAITTAAAIAAAGNSKTIAASIFKLETPPNSTTPITSASDISQTSQDADQYIIENRITVTTATPQHSASQQLQTQRRPQHHFLNGRGIIVRSSDLHNYNTLPFTAASSMNRNSLETEDDEDDPELNDENLQDIEEEAKAAEADEEPPHLDPSQIKVENIEMDTNENTPRLAYTSTATTVTATDADGHSTQLVLPAGSIVSTGARTVTLPVSEALAHLQRRPVFFSNGVTNGTLVRMPAVLSRNGSVAVLNVVQQQVGTNGQTTQLILQAAPMGSGGATNGTPIMLTTTQQPQHQQQVTTATSDNTGYSSPISTVTATSNPHQIITNALATNQQTQLQQGRQHQQQQTTTIMTLNNGSNTSSSTTSSSSPAASSATTNAAISTLTKSPPARTEQQHPIASTSAQAQAAYSRNTASTSPPSSTSSASPSSTSAPSGVGAAGGTTGSTIYQCEECVEKFDNKELFDIHRSGHANNMKCAICNMVLKSLKNYEKHCLRCKPYECQICGRVVRFRPNFIKHMRVHTGQQSERHKYKCEFCQKEFMSFEYFKVHKKIHNENVNLTCEICGKQFSALASLRGHSKLHSGVKLHKCEVCGKGFGQRYNLKIHARTHTGDFPFECELCKKKLHTQSSLQTHMQVHQRVQTPQATSTIRSTATSTTKSGNTSSSSSSGSSVHNSPTSTIIKLEPQLSAQSSPMDTTPSTSSNALLRQRSINDDLDENSAMSDGLNSLNGQYVTTSSVKNTLISATGDDSSESSNTSQEQLRQTRQLLLNGATPTRAIVVNNYLHNNDIKGVDTLLSQASKPHNHQLQQHHAQVIRHNNSSASSSHIMSSSSSSSSSALQQQLMRKTPIIHSTGGATSLSSSVFASAIQHRGISPSPTPSSSSTSCSSSVVVSKSGVPLSLASAALGSSSIIRSTRDHDASFNGHHHNQNHQNHNQRNNHRNHHRRRHLADMDDDNDDTNLHHPSVNNGRHFDDDDDLLDDKSSPSLATTAIKTEPNFYVSGDNSNEMLIKEEIIFDDASANSPHSPPGSKFGMSNFDNDLDHHVDLAHSLPTYGYLLDQHSIPDTIPAQLYADDDDFRLDHNSLGALHNNSSSTNDGDYIKKEWSYGTSSNYTINGKFDDDSNALCDPTNFIYN